MLTPYEVFIGTGICVTIWKEHYCDCEYCERNDGVEVEEKFENEKELQRFLDRGKIPEDFLSKKREIAWIKTFLF